MNTYNIPLLCAHYKYLQTYTALYTDLTNKQIKNKAKVKKNLQKKNHNRTI